MDEIATTRRKSHGPVCKVRQEETNGRIALAIHRREGGVREEARQIRTETRHGGLDETRVVALPSL